MNRLAMLVSVATVCFLASCGGGQNNTPPKNEALPFSGAPDRSSVDTAVTAEARAAIGTLQSALKSALLTKYEGNVDKLAAAVSGQMTAAKANALVGGPLDGNYYKTGDYSLTHKGGGRFEVVVAPGTQREVRQEISVR